MTSMAQSYGRAGPGEAPRLVGSLIAILSIAAGVIHVSAAADHENLPVMMAGFLLVAVCQVALGGLLLWRRPSRLLLAGAVSLMLGSVGMWVVSRTVGLPLLPGGHMEPIGFKDGITVLLELASIPLLMLMFASELDRVRMPSARLRTQAVAFTGAAAFMLFVPALVMGGGGHHSADQVAAMGGHSHGGDGESASAGQSASAHGHGSGAGTTAAGGSDAGSGDHHGTAGAELASAGSGGGHGHAGVGVSSGGAMPTGGDSGSTGGGHEHGGSGGGDKSEKKESTGHEHGGSGDKKKSSGGGHEHAGQGGAQHGGGAGHGDGGHGGGGDHGDAPEGEEPISLTYDEGQPARNGRPGQSPTLTFRSESGPYEEGAHSHELHGGGGQGCRPTPQQQAVADKLYHDTNAVLKRYENNPAAALADGFTQIVGPADRFVHMINFDRVFNPTILKPGEIESFMYAQTDRGLVPLGGMYIMPAEFKDGKVTPTEPKHGPVVAGCLTRWHKHEGWVAAASTAGTNWEETPEMLHVWTYPGLDPWSHYSGPRDRHLLAAVGRGPELLPRLARRNERLLPLGVTFAVCG